MQFPRDKKSPNRWTSPQRQLVCIIKRWFVSVDEHGTTREVQQQEFYQVFRAFFDVEITSRAVVSMCHDMRFKRHPEWIRTNETVPFQNPGPEIRVMKRKILEAASIQDIQLIERCSEPRRFVSTSHPKRSQRAKRPQRAEDYSSESSESEADEMSSEEDSVSAATSSMQSSPSPNDHQEVRHKRVLRKCLPFNPSYSHHDKQGMLVHPYEFDPYYKYHSRTQGGIAFRCWDASPDLKKLEVSDPTLSGLHGTNTREGFWSGTFDQTYPPPPSRNDQQRFGASIFTHLRPLQEPSPWISLWVSLIAAVHRLLRTPTAQMTVIDLDSLSSCDNHEFPYIYPATTLIYQYRLPEIPYPKGTRYTYRGTPEFMIWNHVPPIAILKTISHEDFQVHLRENPLLEQLLNLDHLGQVETIQQFRRLHSVEIAEKTKSTGESVGAFLAFIGVPKRLLPKAAAITATNWKFSKPHTGDSQGYSRGIDVGYSAYISQANHQATGEDSFYTRRRRIERVLGAANSQINQTPETHPEISIRALSTTETRQQPVDASFERLSIEHTPQIELSLPESCPKVPLDTTWDFVEKFEVSDDDQSSGTLTGDSPSPDDPLPSIEVDDTPRFASIVGDAMHSSDMMEGQCQYGDKRKAAENSIRGDPMEQRSGGTNGSTRKDVEGHAGSRLANHFGQIFAHTRRL